MLTRKEFLTLPPLWTSLMPTAVMRIREIGALDQIPSFHFDHARFRQIISRSATHRHVFAAASVSQGSILSAMYNTFYTYESSFGTPASSVLEVGVLYHGMAVTL